MSDASRSLEVVDSFSASVTLSLATIGFVRVFNEGITREEIRRDVNHLEALASRRLSAAANSERSTLACADSRSVWGPVPQRT